MKMDSRTFVGQKERNRAASDLLSGLGGFRGQWVMSPGATAELEDLKVRLTMSTRVHPEEGVSIYRYTQIQIRVWCANICPKPWRLHINHG